MFIETELAICSMQSGMYLFYSNSPGSTQITDVFVNKVGLTQIRCLGTQNGWFS